ncbi:hypothetical protein [Rehaibacterium terrae]|jgi:hypothetical protein|uniref:Uncharacterized protein n=1 Tax=Rehaibacterium terrae TaxID=1341696 RepID=A0A7W8DEF1_9GAMM|nr:hypothetical protein [Rehaibacterium terrae]MBB5015706.1 hypothetical protein [Rehaibacterium terrae]
MNFAGPTTLLLGPLSGLVITVILYLAGCNLLLSRELKQVRARMESHQHAETSGNTTPNGHQEREASPS